jgi:alkylhydroperoxidase family enzyme
MTEKYPAWIHVVADEDADAELAPIYADNTDPNTGQVDHILKIHSLHPQSMLDHIQLYKTLMYGKSPIKRPQREMIAVVVSAINHCRY